MAMKNLGVETPSNVYDFKHKVFFLVKVAILSHGLNHNTKVIPSQM